jgi:hypothetical protein
MNTACETTSGDDDASYCYLDRLCSGNCGMMLRIQGGGGGGGGDHGDRGGDHGEVAASTGTLSLMMMMSMWGSLKFILS